MKRYLYIIVAWLVVVVLAGCKAVKTITTSSVAKVDTVYFSRANDIYHLTHDSVVVYSAPDTFVKEVFRTRDVYHFKLDTVYKVKVDTIKMVQIKETTKNPSKPYFAAFAALFTFGLALYIVGVIKTR